MPFTTRDFEDMAERHGMKGARAWANQFTQHLKKKGLIVGERPRGSSAYLWRPNDPRTRPAAAVLRAPAVTGPFDPPATNEGANSGLTEATAEWLFCKLGGRDVPIGENGIIREINPMEAHGWRVIADQLLRFLHGSGLRMPADHGRPSDWNIVWLYNIGEMGVMDQAGGFICSLCDGDEAELIAAAPTMATAIRTVLARYDGAGGIKRADIDTLRASLPGPQPGDEQ